MGGAPTTSRDAVARYRAAARIPGVAYCAMEYYRWAVRSQLRAEGRRFAVAVARPAEVPVLGPARRRRPLAAPAHRRGVGAVGGASGTPWRSWRASGHFPHEERPTAVTARIADFLDR